MNVSKPCLFDVFHGLFFFHRHILLQFFIICEPSLRTFHKTSRKNISTCVRFGVKSTAVQSIVVKLWRSARLKILCFQKKSQLQCSHIAACYLQKYDFQICPLHKYEQKIYMTQTIIVQSDVKKNHKERIIAKLKYNRPQSRSHTA